MTSNSSGLDTSNLLLMLLQQAQFSACMSPQRDTTRHFGL